MGLGGDVRGGDFRGGDVRGGDIRGGDVRVGDVRGVLEFRGGNILSKFQVPNSYGFGVKVF